MCACMRVLFCVDKDAHDLYKIFITVSNSILKSAFSSAKYVSTVKQKIHVDNKVLEALLLFSI